MNVEIWLRCNTEGDARAAARFMNDALDKTSYARALEAPASTGREVGWYIVIAQNK